MPRTYLCFDADNDIHYYRLLQAWDANPRLPFDFSDAHELARLLYAQDEMYIKSQLRERLEGTEIFMVLVGNNTKYLYRFVRWEIEQALERGLPIIVVNLNGMRAIDTELCPPILRNELAVHISFNQSIIAHAIENWPATARQQRMSGGTGPFYYPARTYLDLESRA